MAWENLSMDIDEEFLGAQSLVVEQLRRSRTFVEDVRARKATAYEAERWKNLKCDTARYADHKEQANARWPLIKSDAAKHAKRKEQNLRAAHKYLEKNREAHNTRCRERARAKARQRLINEKKESNT